MSKPPAPFKRIIQLGTPVKLEPSLKDMPPTAAELSAQETLARAVQEADLIRQQAQQDADQILSQANETAQSITSEAQAKADAQLASVEAQVAATLEEAHAQGYQAGYDAGHQQARQEAQAQLDSAARLVEGAYEQQQHILQHMSRQCVSLMQATLAHLLGEAWANERETLIALTLDQAIEQLHLTGRMTLVVHPQHLATLRTSGLLPLESEGGLSGSTRIRLQGDPLLAMDDVFLITQEGQLDLSLARNAQRILENDPG